MKQQIERLSETEIIILQTITEQDNQITFDELQSLINISSEKLLKSIQSLKRRFLITEKQENNEMILEIDSIMRAYFIPN